MKVKQISINGSQSLFVQSLLNRDILNDIVLDKCFVDIDVIPDSPIDFLYRRLWETMFLRRDMSGWSRFNNSESIILKISFNEAINFIKAVTPPRFKPRIHELYNDIDNIKESLELFLINDADSVINYNTSVFKQGMKFQQFETSSKYNMNRINYIRSKVNDMVVVDVENCSDFKTIRDNPSNNDTDSYVRIDIQCMLSYYNTADLHKTFNDLKDELDSIYILNVFSDGMNGNFIEFYIDGHSVDNVFKSFPNTIKLINNTYQHIF